MRLMWKLRFSLFKIFYIHFLTLCFISGCVNILHLYMFQKFQYFTSVRELYVLMLQSCTLRWVAKEKMEGDWCILFEFSFWDRHSNIFQNAKCSVLDLLGGKNVFTSQDQKYHDESAIAITNYVAWFSLNIVLPLNEQKSPCVLFLFQIQVYCQKEFTQSL